VFAMSLTHQTSLKEGPGDHRGVSGALDESEDCPKNTQDESASRPSLRLGQDFAGGRQQAVPVFGLAQGFAGRDQEFQRVQHI